MMAKYVLLFWPDENQYSIVKRKTLITGYGDEQIVGKQVQCLVNEEYLTGTVFSIGTKSEMKQAEQAAERAAMDNSVDLSDLKSVIGHGDEEPVQVEDVNVMTLRGTKRIKKDGCNSAKPDFMQNPTGVALDNQENESVGIIIPDANGAVSENGVNFDEGGLNAHSEVNPQDLLREKNDLIRLLEKRNARLESENRRIKASAKLGSGDTEETVIIGAGLSVQESYIAFLKLSFGRQPSRFFRELVFRSRLFRLEDVAASSLKGRPKTSAPEGTIPVSAGQFEALIKFTMKSCGIHERSWELAEFKEKIKNVCSDARKALKRKREDPNEQL